MPPKVRCTCLLLLLFSSAAFAHAQGEYSGEIVDMQTPDHAVLAKLYVGNDVRRLDMKSYSDPTSVSVRLAASTKDKSGNAIGLGGSGRAVILNLAAQSTTVLVPDRKTYFRGERSKFRLNDLFALYADVHPKNVENACAEWMRGPGAEEETCRRVDEEVVNGRSTVKYELSCYAEICQLWIDRILHSLVKRVTKWNSTELRNIQESPPNYTLFDIPSDYLEQSPGGIIQRLTPN